ncbi:MAG: helix-hairpin-helix domain-containing protein [Sporichthyaceae bacterium]
MNLPLRLSSARARAEARLLALLPAPRGRAAPAIAPADGTDPDGDLPPALPERTIDARAALVVFLVAAVAIAVAALLLWRARPHAADVGPVPAAVTVAADVGAAPAAAYVTAALVPTPTPTPTATTPVEDPGILVDVQGRVRRPGVVNLPTGARVRDAVNAAGGPRSGANTRGLNLAAPLADGEQVVLGPEPACAVAAQAAGQASGPGPVTSPAAIGNARPNPAVPARPAAPAPPALIDLNRATTAELETLPGVGPVLAQRIVDYRTTRGRFTSIDELREVSGIGPAKFAEIRRLVRV